MMNKVKPGDPLTVTAAAKLLKVAPKTVRAHIRRGLPLVAPASPDGLRPAGGSGFMIQQAAAPSRPANREPPHCQSPVESRQ